MVNCTCRRFEDGERDRWTASYGISIEVAYTMYMPKPNSCYGLLAEHCASMDGESCFGILVYVPTDTGRWIM